jgi:hypothetical protein
MASSIARLLVISQEDIGLRQSRPSSRGDFFCFSSSSSFSRQGLRKAAAPLWLPRDADERERNV